MIKFGWPSFNNKTEAPKPAEVAPAVKAEIPEARSNFKPSPLDELLGINFKPGALVKVQRSSGQMEEGWRVSFEEAKEKDYIIVTKRVGDQVLTKKISRKDLREWNLPERKVVADNKINGVDQVKTNSA